MLGQLLYFGGTILATLIVATLICHYRIAHQKQVSWGAVFASSAIANAVVLISLAFYEAGWHLFTRYAWSEPKGGWAGLIIVLGIITMI